MAERLFPIDWVCFEQDTGTPGMGINTLIGVGMVNPLGPVLPGEAAIFPKLGPQEITLWAAAIGHSTLHDALVRRQSEGVVVDCTGGTGMFVIDPAAPTLSGDEVDATDHFNVSPEDLPQNEWILGINFEGDIPVASFNFEPDPAEGCSPLEVTFTDTSTNSPTTWHWEKNDGGGWVDFDGTPFVQNPVEDFTEGTWSVRLNACNLNGCDLHTETDLIISAEPPVASFTFDPDPAVGAPPLEVDFTDTSTNSPTSWLWEKNNGSGWVNFDGTPTAQNPTEIFASAIWSVRLTVSNVCDDDTDTQIDIIDSCAPPVADFEGEPLAGCVPLTVVFTDLSTNVPTAWHWEKNDGGGWVDFEGTPFVQNPTEEFTEGVWDIRLTATNACSPGEPEIVVTGTFTPPAWNFVGSELVQDVNDEVIDFSGAETITFVDVTGIVGRFSFNSGLDVLLTSIDLTGLVSITNRLDIFVQTLVTLSVPDLETIGNRLQLTEFPGVSPPDFPALVSIGTDLNVFFNPNLTSAPDFPNLETIGDDFNLNDNAAMVTGPDLSSLLAIAGDVDWSNSAFNQASIDAILVKLASLDGTGGTTSYDNHFVVLTGGTNAPPGAAGLAAKATLEGRGNTVTVNP